MADVFISYSKANRRLTERLASILERDGYSVWWDTRLVSGEAFSPTITRELDDAGAVVVIWTADSVGSEWVYAEARHAYRQGKLIQAHEVGLDITMVPKPFDVLHSIPVSDVDGLRRDVFEKIGGEGKTPPPPRGQRQAQQRFRKHLVFGAGAVAILGAAWAAITLLEPSSPPPVEPPSNVKSGDAGSNLATDNVYADFSYADDSGLALATAPIANGYLYGFPTQAGAVKIELFDELGPGSAALIAKTDATTSAEAGYLGVQFPVATKPKNAAVCITYMGFHETGRPRRLVYARHFFPGPNRPAAEARIFPADEAQSCATRLGFKEIEDRTNVLADHSLKQRIEKQYNIAEIYHVDAGNNSRTGFSVQLYAIGGFEKSVDRGRVPDVTMFAYASDNGKVWRGYHKTAANMNFQTLHYENIARPAPPFLLICAASYIQSEKKYVVEMAEYRRDGAQGQYSFKLRKSKELVVADSDDQCRAPDLSTFGETKPDRRPIDVALPQGSGGAFDAATASSVAQSLRQGRAAPYGPAIANLKLGSSFTSALKKARQLLPLGSVAQLENNRMSGAFKSYFGEITAVIDLQEQLAIILAKHWNSDAVAGIWWAYRPFQKERIDLAVYRQRIINAFGSMQYKEDFSDFIVIDKVSSSCSQTPYDMPASGWDIVTGEISTDDIEFAVFMVEVVLPDAAQDNACPGNVRALGRWPASNPVFRISLQDVSMLRRVAK